MSQMVLPVTIIALQSQHDELMRLKQLLICCMISNSSSQTINYPWQ